MRVTVFGGTGFVGSYLVDALLERGHHPVLLVRTGSEHKVNQADRCTLVTGDIANPAAVRSAIDGADAVIYNIGIHLAITGLDWTIFRPSVLFGDPRGRMEFATQLYRDIVRSPLPAPLLFNGMLPLHAGMFRLSPVHVKDVASVFVKALDMPETAGRIIALGGPDALTWKDILQTIAHAAGTRKWTVPTPVLLLKGLAAALDQYAFFPITRDQLTMLMEGNTCDAHELLRTFGLAPTPFEATSLSYLHRDGVNERQRETAEPHQ